MFLFQICGLLRVQNPDLVVAEAFQTSQETLHTAPGATEQKEFPEKGCGSGGEDRGAFTHPQCWQADEEEETRRTTNRKRSCCGYTASVAEAYCEFCLFARLSLSCTTLAEAYCEFCLFAGLSLSCTILGTGGKTWQLFLWCSNILHCLACIWDFSHLQTTSFKLVHFLLGALQAFDQSEQG